MLAMNNLLCNCMSLNEGSEAHCIIGQSRGHTDTNDWLSLWIQQSVVISNDSFHKHTLKYARKL